MEEASFPGQVDWSGNVHHLVRYDPFRNLACTASLVLLMGFFFAHHTLRLALSLGGESQSPTYTILPLRVPAKLYILIVQKKR
ncbi:hypothetical protein GCM10011391_34700 [Pullulanibacillus camelliae]|uniref:Uncharacterized protein n=1 Tax=Pullulanibacillus camelliae TaxID=1707096 RepID=A0A8J3E005_9BACL|nr:hypothetical protein GCM10011391_34700 [Pullulanibacillus camelliae]